MFRSISVDRPGGAAGYLAAGDGKPLLYLPDTPGAELPELMTELTRSRSVAVPLISGQTSWPDSVSDQSAQLQALSAIVEHLGGDRLDVIASGSAAAVALSLAARHASRIDKLILVTPRLGHEHSVRQASPDASVPAAVSPRDDNASRRMLFIIGTQCTDQSRRTALCLKAAFSGSHLAYVYQAGENVAESQPERCRNLVSDFLQRGEAYVIRA